MTSGPTVTVLIPVRDAETTLDEAVASVLAWPEPDEVLLVDDGSRDGSLRCCHAWRRRDARVRVLALPHAGVAAALQAGLLAARGALVARMDADDVAVPGRLALQIPMLEADPTLVAVDGRVELFREGGPVPEGMRLHEAWINGVVEPGDFAREISVESPLVHPAVTFRRAAALAVGGYRCRAGSEGVPEGPVPEDYDLWLRLAAAGWRFRKVPAVVVRMRDRPERLTRTHPAYAREAFRRARMLWLERTALERPRSVVLWGAGREGRPWLRWLLDRGHRVPAVIDIAARKVGSVRRGTPVVPPAALPALDAELCLVAVGARGARALVREALAALRPDWREGRDWYAVR